MPWVAGEPKTEGSRSTLPASWRTEPMSDGVAGLERALLKRPELFAGALAEKLLTFALGRGVEHYDAPAIRGVVRQAEASDFRFSSLILGIASSTPFQMRRSR